MNDVVRTNIKERLVKAIEAENLLAQDVAAIFQMHPSYISWFKNVKYWDKIGENFWERVLAWINSGQSLKEWSEKHGKVLPEKKHIAPVKEVKQDVIIPEKAKTVKEIKPEPLEKLSVNLAEIGWILGLHHKGKSAEKIAKELKIYINIVETIIGKDAIEPEVEKTSDLNFVQLLKEERARIAPQIDAIDVLLKHYIS